MAPVRFRPKLEELEGRDLPSAASISIDFTPDNTNVVGESSAFFATFQGQINQAQTAILNAFQTWANVADINFSLMDGNGSNSPTPYADPNLSSMIHISAIPLADTVGAISSAINSASAVAGEMLLNTNQSFSVNGSPGNYDLFTVALHETGILLGLPENYDPTSVMYWQYQGSETGLGTNDVTAIQHIYGAPVAGDVATAASNGSVLLTSLVTGAPAPSNTMPSPSNTTIPPSTTTPPSNTTTPPSTTIPPSNTTIPPSTTAPPSNAFIPPSTTTPSTTTTTTPSNTTTPPPGTTTTPPSGTTMPPSGTPAQGSTSTINLGLTTNFQDQLTAAGQVNSYTVCTPSQMTIGSSSNMLISVNTSGAAFTPQVSVFNNGVQISTTVLVEQDGIMTVELLNVAPSQNYVVEVGSASGAVGTYNMSFVFAAAPVAAVQSTGSLNALTPNTAGVLQVTQAQVVHFVLSGNTTDGTTNTALQMTIWNSQNQIVEMLYVPTGLAASVDVLLAPGNYTVGIAAVSTNGGVVAPINFSLISYVVTNPIDITPSDPTSNLPAYTPPPPPPNATIIPPTAPPNSTMPLIDWLASFWWQTTPIGGTVTY